MQRESPSFWRAVSAAVDYAGRSAGLGTAVGIGAGLGEWSDSGAGRGMFGEGASSDRAYSAISELWCRWLDAAAVGGIGVGAGVS